MRTLLAIFAALFVFTTGPAMAQAPDHAAWDRLLERYVTTDASGLNRVDYAAWRASAGDRQALAGYIEDLADTPVSTLPRNDQFALWANLYNALTVQEVLNAYPVRSIRSIRSRGTGLDPAGFTGPWRTRLVTVEGRSLSLDAIEHEILRPTFGDPRVHYAVNCASVGCPNLQREAFRGEELDAQLDAAARAYVNSNRGVELTRRGLRLSQIYSWFREDFGSEQDLRAHLARYATGQRAQRIPTDPIVGYQYDWDLNDTSR
jgi:hypothetical protein